MVESSYPKEALPPLAGFDRERDGVVNIANNPGQVDEHLLPTSSQVISNPVSLFSVSGNKR